MFEGTRDDTRRKGHPDGVDRPESPLAGQCGVEGDGQTTSESGARKTPTTIVVVDHDEHTRRVVEQVAEAMGQRCLWLETSQTLYEVLAEHQPGCLILEAALEAGDTSLMHRRVVQHCEARGHPAPPMVFVSGLGSIPAAVRALRGGAFHFLEKPLDVQEVWNAVSESLIVHREHGRLWEQRHRIEERAARLNDADWHLLRLLCDGLSKKRIAESLGVCVRTVEIRRNRLMRKLEVESVVALIRFGIREADWRERQAAMTGHFGHPIKPPGFLTGEARAAGARARGEQP